MEKQVGRSLVNEASDEFRRNIITGHSLTSSQAHSSQVGSGELQGSGSYSPRLPAREPLSRPLSMVSRGAPGSITLAKFGHGLQRSFTVLCNVYLPHSTVGAY